MVPVDQRVAKFKITWIALRGQRIVLFETLPEFAPDFGSVFLHTASVEGDWQVLGYESWQVSGKHDISSSGNHGDILAGQPILVEQLKIVGILRSRQATTEQGP
jgi:hypothetical protein